MTGGAYPQGRRGFEQMRPETRVHARVAGEGRGKLGGARLYPGRVCRESIFLHGLIQAVCNVSFQLYLMPLQDHIKILPAHVSQFVRIVGFE